MGYLPLFIFNQPITVIIYAQQEDSNGTGMPGR